MSSFNISELFDNKWLAPEMERTVVTTAAMAGLVTLCAALVYKTCKDYFNRPPAPDFVFTEANHRVSVISRPDHLNIAVEGDLSALSDGLKRKIAQVLKAWYQQHHLAIRHKLPDHTMYELAEKWLDNEQPYNQTDRLHLASYFRKNAYYEIDIKQVFGEGIHAFRSKIYNSVNNLRKDLGITREHYK